MHSSAFGAAKSVTRRAVSSLTRHAGRCRGGLPQNNNGAQAACVAAGGALVAFAFVQHRQFVYISDEGGRDFPRPFGESGGNMRISPVGPKAFAEAPNDGRGDQNNDTDEDTLKTAAGWVKEVRRDGLAKFLSETILGDVGESTDTSNDKSPEETPDKPKNSQSNNLFGTIKGAVGDVVENVTGVVESVTEAVEDVVEDVTDVVEKVKATKEGKTDSSRSTKDGKTVRTGSEGFASLTDLVSGIVFGKSSSNEAVRNLIDSARENVDVGDVDDSASLEELYALFRDLWLTLDKAFAGVVLSRFDPTALFYFLELEDEKKNPSWKRRVHRYMKGVDVRMVNDLFDALQFAHLAYACKESDIRDGLESFSEKYELVYYDPESKPGEPSHYLALKKGQSRWSNTLDVILSVRGTDSIDDILTDSLGIPVEYRGGKAHDGFVRSGKHIVELHKPLLEEMLRMSGKKKIKLRIYGHSLGGATGTIAGIEFNDDERFDVEAVGFGCPASLSKDLSEKYKGIITTVINDADCIPRMNCSTLANAAIAIMSYDYTPKARRDAEQALNELKNNASILIGESEVKLAMDLVDKAMKELIRPAILKNDVPKSRIEPEIFPPGRCIHFYQDGRSVSGSYAPCTFFDELDITRTMLDDHMIKRGYHRLFLELMREYHDDDHFAFDRKEFDF